MGLGFLPACNMGRASAHNIGKIVIKFMALWTILIDRTGNIHIVEPNRETTRPISYISLNMSIT